MNMSIIYLYLVILLTLMSREASGDKVQMKPSGNSGYMVSVEYKGRKLDFDLRRSSEEIKFDLWESRDQTLNKLTSQNVELIEDAVSGASLIVSQQLGKYSIQGTLGDNIFIRPTLVTEDGKNNSYTGCLVCLPLLSHTISTQEMSGGNADDYEEMSEVDPKLFSARRGRNVPFAVHPEVLVMVDYDLYAKNGYDANKARNYAASFLNGVNLRFRSLSSPSVKLHVAAIVVETTRGSFSFLSRNKLSRNRLEAPGALHNMGVYFYSSGSQYPQFDMVLLLTGMDMARRQGGVLSSATSGYAYVGGACVRNVALRKISSVAIVEDSGGYSGVIVATHELGHLLGSVHDGDSSPSYLRGPGAKSCSWSQGYIMSDRRSSTRGVQWSRCSVKQMRYFLATPAAQCLQNKPRSVEYYLDDSNPPGVQISLDYQCFKDKGTRACFKNSGVCTQLFCYQPDSRSCLSYRPAVEGSECSPGSWCRNAKCVKKPSYTKSTNTLVKKSFNVESVFTNRNNPTIVRQSPKKTNSNYNFKFNTQKKTNYYKTPTYATTRAPTIFIKTNFLTKSQTSFIKPTKTYYSNPTTTYRTTTYYNSPTTTTTTTYFTPSQKNFIKKTSFMGGSVATTSSDFTGGRNTRNTGTCRDTPHMIQGSLSCVQLFERYAFHYCVKSRVVRTECCQSYNAFCKAG